MQNTRLDPNHYWRGLMSDPIKFKKREMQNSRPIYSTLAAYQFPYWRHMHYHISAIYNPTFAIALFPHWRTLFNCVIYNSKNKRG